jgi:hypothetical protein
VPKLFTFTQDHTAGTNWIGTEFRVQSPSRNALRLKELDLKMGTEAKAFRIEKRDRDGNPLALLHQSTDSVGNPAVTTAESVVITGAEYEVILEPGDQIQVISSGMTAASRVKLYFEEMDLQAASGTR